MVRTTIDLDPSVLAELKERQRREGKSLGRVASELLARALAEEGGDPGLQPLHWATAAMGARVDLGDKEALNRLLDGP